MTEDETARLIAWSTELRTVHHRLREALSVTRHALDDGADATAPTRDLLLFCRGFCVALTGHHQDEDRTLFPAVAARFPELRDTLRRLEQDHTTIAALLDALDDAVERSSSPAELNRHLDGVAAIMESHFRFEERQLLSVLDALAAQ